MQLMIFEQVVETSTQSINGRRGKSGAVSPWYPCVQVSLQEPCRSDVPVSQEEPAHAYLKFNGSTTLLLSVASFSEYIYSVFIFL
jgi:hypothetical protein